VCRLEEGLPELDTSLRGLWLAVFALTALVVGLIAGVLTWAAGAGVLAAIFAGAGGFVGTIVLLLAAAEFVARGP